MAIAEFPRIRTAMASDTPERRNPPTPFVRSWETRVIALILWPDEDPHLVSSVSISRIPSQSFFNSAFAAAAPIPPQSPTLIFRSTANTQRWVFIFVFDPRR